MRAIAILVFLPFVVASTNARSVGVWCTDQPNLAALPTVGGVGNNQYSSFRDISLASKSGDVASNSVKLGFLIYITTFHGLPNAVSSIDICHRDDRSFPSGTLTLTNAGKPFVSGLQPGTFTSVRLPCANLRRRCSNIIPSIQSKRRTIIAFRT